MATEYRVKWKREGLRPKRIRYTSMKAAERRLALLTSDEPWLYYGDGNDPSGYQCCSGHECGCGGITVREHCEQIRAEMPPIEYAVIECRPVGAWVSVEQHNYYSTSCFSLISQPKLASRGAIVGKILHETWGCSDG